MVQASAGAASQDGGQAALVRATTLGAGGNCCSKLKHKPFQICTVEGERGVLHESRGRGGREIEE